MCAREKMIFARTMLNSSFGVNPQEPDINSNAYKKLYALAYPNRVLPYSPNQIFPSLDPDTPKSFYVVDGERTYYPEGGEKK